VSASLGAKRRQRIISLCLPGYVPLVAYGTLLVLSKLPWHPNPVGMLGATFAVLYICAAFVSGLSCALAPISCFAALILFWRDPWRDQRPPKERSRLLVLVLGSGVAWFVGVAIFGQLAK
jgi:hypothetical protein